MAGRKRTASRANATNATASRSTRSTRSNTRRSDVPDIYNQMLADVDIQPHTTLSERPLKRRKPSQKNDHSPKKPDPPKAISKPEDVDDDDDVQFEDVPLPAATMQTVFRDSDEEDDDDEIQFENVDLSIPSSNLDNTEDGNKDLELNFSARMAASPRKSADRRKPISKEEKGRRMEIHKMHILCLLAHVARRNRWCNDNTTQKTLRKLLTNKMITYLNPSTQLSQFGRANSLKEGLQQVGTMFKTKYQVTERGIRRSLWADNEQHLQNYKLPDDAETPMEKDDFREAAKSLCGSRDVGAQLYCALLRSAGVEARLVCSLQPLAFTPGGPPLGKPPKAKGKSSIVERYAQQSKREKAPDSPAESSSSSSSVLRRLGHPKAAAFHLPTIPTAPSPREAPPISKKIRESPYPIYWVEILDEAHQKWQPADPLVTCSFWKPQNMEPPASDRENSMTYVVAFQDDGTVKDVTRRYTKAYNAKTRKMRIESAESTGEKWWQKTLRTFSRGFPTDLDRIEDSELADKQLREPMPRNIADFKDHPIFVLKRHLRRNEVLVPNAPASGTVGPGSTGPLEKVYRHKDLRIAHSRDKWYRMGREVLPNEIPAKFLPKRKRPKSDLFDDDEGDDDPSEPNGIPIYTFDQTKQFKHPPVVNGQVPKNRFRNIDLYVPSMVPEGGAYVADELGARAAFILGVDYAPALTGFQFKGRQGTAVLHGVVVAAETEEAVRAVISGIKDQAAELEKDRRTQVVLKAWRLFLMSLRVRQRIFADVDSEDEGDNQEDIEIDKGKEIAHEHDSEDEEKQSENSDEGGGFMVDDEYAGGFMVD
ncbi:Rad4-domain-containing protein [Annulohypoxylon maeteangense]|uniref:Rad4-domain-containing protein n=1 Tax=Annulohypoxylon maeteangense TaxID=1927788 RepID=UPI0020075305|nr:Rad4-domain-containing protein [Annulohypoxylon maeteangense]KAI0888001.1 Rad4-domain-containing protein [Annulohypoxylon maeteangense]